MNHTNLRWQALLEACATVLDRDPDLCAGKLVLICPGGAKLSINVLAGKMARNKMRDIERVAKEKAA